MGAIRRSRETRERGNTRMKGCTLTGINRRKESVPLDVMHCKQTHKSTLGPMNLYIKIILNHIP